MSDAVATYETRKEFLTAIMEALSLAAKHRPGGYPFREWLLKDKRFSRDDKRPVWSFGNWQLTDDYLDYLISRI